MSFSRSIYPPTNKRVPAGTRYIRERIIRAQEHLRQQDELIKELRLENEIARLEYHALVKAYTDLRRGRSQCINSIKLQSSILEDPLKEVN